MADSIRIMCIDVSRLSRDAEMGGRLMKRPQCEWDRRDISHFAVTLRSRREASQTLIKWHSNVEQQWPREPGMGVGMLVPGGFGGGDPDVELRL